MQKSMDRILKLPNIKKIYSKLIRLIIILKKEIKCLISHNYVKKKISLALKYEIINLFKTRNYISVKIQKILENYTEIFIFYCI